MDAKQRVIDLSEKLRASPIINNEERQGMLTHEEILVMREEVEQTREEARAAGVEGVPRRGLLFPSMRDQVRMLDTPEVTHAYIVAYGPLSSEQHFGHLSFREAVQYVREDGVMIYEEPETERGGEKALASAIFASTLVIASEWLGLGFDPAAERIRVSLVGR